MRRTFCLPLLLLSAAACQSEGSHWVHNRGVFEPGKTHATLDAGLEFRTPSSRPELEAIVGGTLLDEEDCQGHCGNYFYTGLRYPLFPESIFDAGLGVAVGGYHAGEVQLGSVVILRPGLDVSVSLGEGVSLGGYVHHFTSGPWGDEDPGAEAVGVTLGWRF